MTRTTILTRQCVTGMGDLPIGADVSNLPLRERQVLEGMGWAVTVDASRAEERKAAVLLAAEESAQVAADKEAADQAANSAAQIEAQTEAAYEAGLAALSVSEAVVADEAATTSKKRGKA